MKRSSADGEGPGDIGILSVQLEEIHRLAVPGNQHLPFC